VSCPQAESKWEVNGVRDSKNDPTEWKLWRIMIHLTFLKNSHSIFEFPAYFMPIIEKYIFFRNMLIQNNLRYFAQFCVFLGG
jgi:hypothetical protein